MNVNAKAVTQTVAIPVLWLGTMNVIAVFRRRKVAKDFAETERTMMKMLAQDNLTITPVYHNP